MLSSAAPSLGDAVDLSVYGINSPLEVIYNPSFETLFTEETREDLQGFERSVLTDLGAVAVDTGEFTGRSPKDKYIVKDDQTRDTLWWSDQGRNDNQAIDQQVWNDLRTTVTDQLSGKRLFVVDTFCGANEDLSLIHI